MREERLLKRIRMYEQDPHRHTGENPRLALTSIVEHLQLILNTKQGSVPIGLDYGLPDLTELLRSYPDSIRDFERSIRSTIQKYEPRLTMVRVKLVPQDEDPFVLNFQISARLIHNNRKMGIVLHSSINEDGKIQINE